MLPITINKPSGTVNLANTTGTFYDWTYVAGSVDPGNNADRQRHVKLRQSYANYYTRYYVRMNGGALIALGVVVQAKVGSDESTLVTFSGPAARTWTSTGGSIPGTVLTVNKPWDR